MQHTLNKIRLFRWYLLGHRFINVQVSVRVPMHLTHVCRLDDEQARGIMLGNWKVA